MCSYLHSHLLLSTFQLFSSFPVFPHFPKQILSQILINDVQVGQGKSNKISLLLFPLGDTRDAKHITTPLCKVNILWFGKNGDIPTKLSFQNIRFSFGPLYLRNSKKFFEQYYLCFEQEKCWLLTKFIGRIVIKLIMNANDIFLNN